MSQGEHLLFRCGCILCNTWRRVGSLLARDLGPAIRDQALHLVRGLETQLLDLTSAATPLGGLPPVAVGAGPPPPPGLYPWGFVPAGGLIPPPPPGPERFDKGPLKTPGEEGSSSAATAPKVNQEGPAAKESPAPEEAATAKESKKEKKPKEKRKERKSPGRRRKKSKASEEQKEEAAKETPEAEGESSKVEKSKSPEAAPSARDKDWVPVKVEADTEEEEEVSKKSKESPEEEGENQGEAGEEAEGAAGSARDTRGERRAPCLRSVSRGGQREREEEGRDREESGEAGESRESRHRPREPDHPPPRHRPRSPVRPPGRFSNWDYPSRGWGNSWWAQNKGKNKRERAEDIRWYGLDPERRKERKQRRWCSDQLQPKQDQRLQEEELQLQLRQRQKEKQEQKQRGKLLQHLVFEPHAIDLLRISLLEEREEALRRSTREVKKLKPTRFHPFLWVVEIGGKARSLLTKVLLASGLER